MSITGALLIASGEIGNINNQISVISHNIANANTAQYSVEDVLQIAVTSGDVGMGAMNGVVQRAAGDQGRGDLLTQNGVVGALQTEQAALQQIDAAGGSVGSGNDIGSLLGKLENSFSALASTPDNQGQQQQVVAVAQQLATQANSISNTVGGQRQAAQDAVVGGVASLNTGLASLGSLSDQIMKNSAAGISTADLENQRDAVMATVSGLVSVRFLAQPGGDLIAVTASGINLPIHGPTSPFTTSSAAVAPGSFAPGGGVPAITLNGHDVTGQLTGGTIGGNLALRDTTLPTIQANLDEFTYTLASRFDAQGLTLFTDLAGNAPTATGTTAQAGYFGFAGMMQVNPAVVGNPALVRDGSHAVASGGGGATAFLPNPVGGPAGFAGLVTRVVQYTFGSQVSMGVAQPPPSVTGLGPSGTLTAGFAAPANLGGLAAAVTATEAELSGSTTALLTTAQATQTTLQATVTSNTAVSIDGEMSKMIVLQNAYGANARIISAVQSMWTQLLQVVQ